MKKILALILCLGFAVTLVSTAADEVTVEIDGIAIEFDVNPEIIEGRTMVPLRKIFEEIGAKVKWNADAKTISARKNSKTVTLTVDSAELKLDKGKTDDEGNPIIETISLEVPATIIEGRTLVPVRAISESFGMDVSWDEEDKKVIITSDDEDDDSWKENVGKINLSDLTYEGEGIEISGNQIKIGKGGDFVLTGALSDGNITVSAKERVKLRLSGADITSENNPCIFVEETDKAYITITGGTENRLIAKNSEDGAIYSKENLEIKGDGSLYMESLAGHGMKASDNLSIENGVIKINASSDGIHINDTFKMSGGSLDITAVGDGIDSESIVDISGGVINIETNGTPIEAEKTGANTAEEPFKRGHWEEESGVEFEKSTKGINAEWMMVITGGEINVNSASHAIHCQDEIEISGGKFTLSSKYDKGISAHGNLTIDGADTLIDVTKSTEGIESKNVMTINDGNIKVVSTDDAVNATGGSSGMMPMPGGNFEGMPAPPEGFGKGQRVPGNREAGMGDKPPMPWMGENGGNSPPLPEMNGNALPPEEIRQVMGGGRMPGGNRSNMKDCLIINGGYFELCGSDDCLDANGNMVISGGVIKASNPTGSFSGNFGVIDPDGQLKIGEYAEIILASGSGNERSLSLLHNTIIIYCETKHEAEEVITLSHSDGNVISEYAPKGSFKAVLISSGDIKTGEKYVITIGNETFETEITEKSTVIGTQSTSGMGFGRGGRMQ